MSHHADQVVQNILARKKRRESMTTETQSGSRSGFRILFIAVLLCGLTAIALLWKNNSKPLLESDSFQNELPPAESFPAPRKARAKPVIETQEIAAPEAPEILSAEGQLPPQSVAAVTAPVPQLSIQSNSNPAPLGTWQEIAAAACQGDTNAVNQLAELNRMALESFKAARASSQNAEELGALTKDLFAPIHAAFKEIVEQAVAGNQSALDALSSAAQTKELQEFAIGGLGTLAGLGNETALDALLNPGHYDIHSPSTLGALKPAAVNGNQRAIDALAAVALDGNAQTLWFVAAAGLEHAAAAGNEVAIDAMINILKSENPNVRSRAIAGLTQAAQKSFKAAQALRTIR
jgi:hypothetical protein